MGSDEMAGAERIGGHTGKGNRMSWVLSRFRAGDWVEVKSVAEILAGLDARGCRDGMPFMPEMIQYCGRRFRVGAVAHKTCDMVREPGTGRRLDATVHLEGLRCDGLAHDGCQAECNLFWKDDWLRPVDENESTSEGVEGGSQVESNGLSEARLRSLTKTEPGPSDDRALYFCQATEMFEATAPLKWWDPRQYLFDVVTGNHGPQRVMRVMFLSALRRFLHHTPIAYRIVRRFSDVMHRWLTGRPAPDSHPKVPDGMETPTGRTGLKAGDLVRIKSQSEIEETLNQRNRNRGLTFDPEEMAPYCGHVVRVRSVVTKIIEEPTGRMLTMKQPCIMLDGVVCRSEYARRRLNCPRAIPSYWREIWLDRVVEEDDSKK